MKGLRLSAVVHFLGVFECDGPRCVLCGVHGVRVAWLCRGEVFSVALCDAHAGQVPRSTMKVEDLKCRFGAKRLHRSRGAFPRLSRPRGSA